MKIRFLCQKVYPRETTEESKLSLVAYECQSATSVIKLFVHNNKENRVQRMVRQFA